MKRGPLALVACALLAACGRKSAPASSPKSAKPFHEHRFDHADEWAKKFDDPERDAWQKPALIVSAMSIAAGSTVVDLGAGTGYFVGYLSRAVGPSGKVLALDVEPDMVRYLKERTAREGLGNVTAQLVRTDDPLLGNETVDRILVVDTWHHIPDRPLYAARLHDALRVGGSIAIVDYTLESPMGPPIAHRLSPEVVCAELTAVGLKAEIAKVALPEQYMVIARR